MVAIASRTQSAAYSFLPVRNGPVLEGALDFGLLRARARACEKVFVRLISYSLSGRGFFPQFFQASFDTRHVAGIFDVTLRQLPEQAQGLLVMGAGLFDLVLISIQNPEIAQRRGHIP